MEMSIDNYQFKLNEKEAQENISNICAKQRAKVIKEEVLKEVFGE